MKKGKCLVPRFKCSSAINECTGRVRGPLVCESENHMTQCFCQTGCFFARHYAIAWFRGRLVGAFGHLLLDEEHGGESSTYFVAFQVQEECTIPLVGW